MLTIIVSGRNDDYGKDFRPRLYRTAMHNAALLSAAGIDFEYFLAEWNPLPDRAPLSAEFVSKVPNARAVIIPGAVHEAYTLNPSMPFHEMPAKNAAIRRANGDVVIVTNADILFSEDLVRRIAEGRWSGNCLYRAHRIDVKAELDWNEMQDPANQLPSGEGRLCPPYYLGAGGDFCLATRALWHKLRGFNETVRFSTRAKDWQFFLSAAAEGIDIEFIGDVYHLDHEGGFRNTAAKNLNSQAVHFGKWWDIEFGLPIQNPVHWGFSNLPETAYGADGQIIVLDASRYFVTEEQNTNDREMMKWIAPPSAAADTSAAILLHTIFAAYQHRRRLICRVTKPALLAALSGFEAIASRYSVDIRCNANLSVAPGYTYKSFTPEPGTLCGIDWVLEENGADLEVYDYSTGERLDVLPAAVKVNEPGFNPVLSRRLLRAYLQLHSDGGCSIAVYGAGGHTKELLKWGIPDSIQLAGIFEQPPNAVRADAVLLSSASFESDMLERCRQANIHNVIALYTDWPKDMWATGVIA
ncbi:MAG TPA: hypothetical protein VKY31_01925 [Terriglobia bacterium]|nr:hypothetical protein [Terriglobia bacterium]